MMCWTCTTFAYDLIISSLQSVVYPCKRKLISVIVLAHSEIPQCGSVASFSNLVTDLFGGLESLSSFSMAYSGP